MKEATAEKADEKSVMKEMTKSVIRSKFMHALSTSTVPLPPRGEEVWGIFLKGERVGLYNKKKAWAKRHHAIAALRRQVGREFDRIIREIHNNGTYMSSKEETKFFNSYLTELQDDGVLEFRRLA